MQMRGREEYHHRPHPTGPTPQRGGGGGGGGGGGAGEGGGGGVWQPCIIYIYICIYVTCSYCVYNLYMIIFV